MPSTAFCFDLESTITKAEILPRLSNEIDMKDEILALTNLTMDGLFPFELSFKIRMKLLSLIPLEKCISIINDIPLNSKIVEFIKANLSNSFILTGNLDIFVDEYIRTHIGCKYFSSIADVKDGFYRNIKKFINKRTVLLEIKKSYDKVVAIGDGSNDIEMLKASDIGIAFSGARSCPQDLLDAADYHAQTEDRLLYLLTNLS